MSDISSWYPAAASNNVAAPDGWPEGMSPADVNNCAREMMAAVKRNYIRRKYGDTTRAEAIGGTGFGTSCYAYGRRPFYYENVGGSLDTYVIVGTDQATGKGAISAGATLPWSVRALTVKSSGVTGFNAVYGNGAGTLWVAVGAGGVIYTSTDLSTWTSRTSGTANALNDVFYANSLWVAVGDSGTILTSSDATTWTSRTSALSGNLYGIAYGASVWVVAGVFGTTGVVQSSSDATTWTERSTGSLTSGTRGVTFANSRFVIGGSAGNVCYASTSTNGTAWSTVYTGPDSTLITGLDGTFTAPVYDSGSWVIGCVYGLLVSHNDTSTWETVFFRVATISGHRVLFKGKDGHPSLGSDASGYMYVGPSAW